MRFFQRSEFFSRFHIYSLTKSDFIMCVLQRLDNQCNVCIYLCLSEKDPFSPSAGKRELEVISLAQIWKYDISAPSKMPYFHTYAMLEFHIQPRNEHNLEGKGFQFTEQDRQILFTQPPHMIGWAVSISDTRYQAHLESGLGHQMPGIGYRIYQIYQIRDIGCQISGYPMQVIGYRVQSAKSIYLRLREQNSPLSTLWQRELEVRTGEITHVLYCLKKDSLFCT